MCYLLLISFFCVGCFGVISKGSSMVCCLFFVYLVINIYVTN